MSDKKAKKKGKGEETPDAATAGEAVSIAAHPRAKASIRRIRAWSALVAFALVLYLSLSADVGGQEAAMRAIAGGLVGNLIGWFCALALWRQIVVQEVRSVEAARRARARARAEAATAAADAV
jgi:hypothetical protein